LLQLYKKVLGLPFLSRSFGYPYETEGWDERLRAYKFIYLIEFATAKLLLSNESHKPPFDRSTTQSKQHVDLKPDSLDKPTTLWSALVWEKRSGLLPDAPEALSSGTPSRDYLLGLVSVYTSPHAFSSSNQLLTGQVKYPTSPMVYSSLVGSYGSCVRQDETMVSSPASLRSMRSMRGAAEYLTITMLLRRSTVINEPHENA